MQFLKRFLCIIIIIPTFIFSQIVINELMIQPFNSDFGEEFSEYIELYNISDHGVDLEGWSIETNSGLAIIADLAIESNGYALLGMSSNTNLTLGLVMDYAWGFGTGVSLNNIADVVRLSDQFGSTVDIVEYQGSWPSIVSGASVELINPLYDNNGASHWETGLGTYDSESNKGTPNTINASWEPVAAVNVSDLDFGVIEFGTMVTESILIQSVGEVDLVIDAIETDDEGAGLGDYVSSGMPDWDSAGQCVFNNYDEEDEDGNNIWVYNASITSKVYPDGIEGGAIDDLVAVFHEDELRGVGCASEVPVFLGQGFAFLMMVYSSNYNGDSLNFQYYDASENTVYNVFSEDGWDEDYDPSTPNTQEFATNMVIGDVTNPLVLTYNTTSVNDDGTAFEILAPELPMTIAHGESFNLGVMFNPSFIGLEYFKNLTFYTNAVPNNNFEVSLSGNSGYSQVQLETPNPNAGEVYALESSTFYIEITNTGVYQLVLDNPSFENQNSDFSIQTPMPVIIPAYGSDSIAVVFTPTQAYTVSDNLLLTTNDPEQPDMTIPLSGYGLMPVIEVEDSLNISTIHADEVSTTNFAVHNSGNGDLIIENIAMNDSHFTVNNLPLTVSEGSTEQLEIVFTPSYVGDYTATAILTSNDPFNSTLNFTIDANAISATIVFVPLDSPTIQGGIDLAENGDTVLVEAGTYRERIDFNGKEITLLSEDGPENTIITDPGQILYENNFDDDSSLDGWYGDGWNDQVQVVGNQYHSPPHSLRLFEGYNGSSGGAYNLYLWSPEIDISGIDKNDIRIVGDYLYTESQYSQNGYIHFDYSYYLDGSWYSGSTMFSDSDGGSSYWKSFDINGIPGMPDNATKLKFSFRMYTYVYSSYENSIHLDNFYVYDMTDYNSRDINTSPTVTFSNNDGSAGVAVFDGFTIDKENSFYGQAIRVLNVSAIIKNCIILDHEDYNLYAEGSYSGDYISIENSLDSYFENIVMEDLVRINPDGSKGSIFIQNSNVTFNNLSCDSLKVLSNIGSNDIYSSSYYGNVGYIKNSDVLFNNSSFTNNSLDVTEQGRGGVFYVESGSLTFDNCTASGNISDAGSFIYAENDSVSLSFNNMHIESNTSLDENSSTIIFEQDGAVYADNLTMINNTGKAIDFLDGGLVALNNSNISNNSSYAISSNDISLSGSTINENENYGIHGTNINIEDSWIDGNNGRGIFISNVSNDGFINANNSSISGNEGGGIASIGNVLLESCIVDSNYVANDVGGAVKIDGNLIANNTSFNGNSAMSGGGLYVTGDVSIDNCDVSYNTIVEESDSRELYELYILFDPYSSSSYPGNLGGRIVDQTGYEWYYFAPGSYSNELYAEVTLPDGNYQLIPEWSDEYLEYFYSNNNSYYDYGYMPHGNGGQISIFVLATQLNLYHDNVATDSYPVFTLGSGSGGSGAGSSGSGGGLSVSGDLTINGSNIVSNTAGFGGGVYHNNGEYIITSTTIDGNHAHGNGGGILTSGNGSMDQTYVLNNTADGDGAGFYGNGDVLITYSQINDNIASINGGGLYWDSGQMTVQRTDIRRNQAAVGGGAYINAENPIFQFDVIANNHATSNGGGFFITKNSTLPSTPIIFNSTLVYNTATVLGSGLLCSNQTNPVVQNSIFWGNASADGVQIHLQGSSEIFVSFCDIAGDEGGIVGFDDIIYQDNLNVDPDFLDRANEDYSLNITSLCIDSGNPNSPNDPDGTTADMGAYYFDQVAENPGCMDESSQNYDPNANVNLGCIYGPSFISVYDAPDDQGGYVFLNWEANSLDVLPNTIITNYSAWRFIPNERGWEHLGDIPASYEASYGFTAPTIETTNIDGDTLYTTFKIKAHTEDQNILYESMDVQGYSIDNLFPGTPMGLYSYLDNGYAHLTWDESIDPDLNYYEVYRNDEFVEYTQVNSFSEQIDELPAEYYIIAYDNNMNSSEQSESFLLSDSIEGDINFDNQVNVVDLVIIIDIILDNYNGGEIVPGYVMISSDLNDDSVIDVLDAVIMIDMIMTINSN